MDYTLIDPSNHASQVVSGTIDDARKKADELCNGVEWGARISSPIPVYTEILDCDGNYIEVYKTLVECEVGVK